MTYSEFQTLWGGVCQELEHMLAAYAAVESYKDIGETRLSRAEMTKKAVRMIRAAGLPFSWVDENVVEALPGGVQEALSWLRYRTLHSAGLGPDGVDASTIEIKSSYMPLVRINAPEWFKRHDFMAWVCGMNTATWHAKHVITGVQSSSDHFTARPNMEATEGSDVFFTWTAMYEGSDASFGTQPAIPEDIWEFISDRLMFILGIRGEALIWLSNLDY